MATIIDIIISFSLGGIILLIILNANQIAGENSSILSGDMLVQQLMVSTAQIVEGEFRNMGVGVNPDSASVRAAYDTAITFLTDFGRDGTIDVVQYWAGKTSDIGVKETQNDSDRFLYRRVNSLPATPPYPAVGVVTKFGLKYFTQNLRDTIPTPVASGDLRMIKVIEITLEIQNPYALYRKKDEVRAGERDALFSSSLWRQTRLASQNLKR